jgi:hypothetical protein
MTKENKKECTAIRINRCFNKTDKQQQNAIVIKAVKAYSQLFTSDSPVAASVYFTSIIGGHEQHALRISEPGRAELVVVLREQRGLRPRTRERLRYTPDGVYS